LKTKQKNNRKKQKKMNAENKEKFIDAACWVAVLSAAAYFVIRIIVELF